MSSERRFTHKAGTRIEVDGASIYHEMLEGEDGPTLVMLHGGFGTIEDFNPILPDLTWPFSIVGIDSRGHGASTCGDRALSYERLQQDVEAVAHALGLGRCCLIGFSDGGIVAYRLASLEWLKVEALVTIGSRWHQKYIGESRQILGGVTAESWEKKFPDTVAAYRRLNPDPDFAVLVPKVVGMWLDSTETGYANEAVGKIDCPTLVVRGDDDQLLSRRAAVEAAEIVPDGHLLNIPFEGHGLFPGQREMFTLAVNHFLEAATA